MLAKHIAYVNIHFQNSIVTFVPNDYNVREQGLTFLCLRRSYFFGEIIITKCVWRTDDAVFLPQKLSFAVKVLFRLSVHLSMKDLHFNATVLTQWFIVATDPNQLPGWWHTCRNINLYVIWYWKTLNDSMHAFGRRLILQSIKQDPTYTVYCSTTISLWGCTHP